MGSTSQACEGHSFLFLKHPQVMTIRRVIKRPLTWTHRHTVTPGEILNRSPPNRRKVLQRHREINLRHHRSRTVTLTSQLTISRFKPTPILLRYKPYFVPESVLSKILSADAAMNPWKSSPFAWG